MTSNLLLLPKQKINLPFIGKSISDGKSTLKNSLRKISEQAALL